MNRKLLDLLIGMGIAVIAEENTKEMLGSVRSMG
jgi:hypothetical protein